jgi:pimeloyl-ACP methyl ester carboxylesterase
MEADTTVTEPLESLVVPTRYGNTYILASGPQDAPPLFLLPAMGVTSTMWQPNLAALGRKYRIYALDTIGDQGRSTLNDLDVYPRNGKAYSEWLADVFDKLGIEQAQVAGASYGGWLAMNHAIHAPERVSRIVLLGPMGLPSWWTTLKVLSHLWKVLLFPTQANIDQITQWALGNHPSVRAAFADFIALGAREVSKFRLAPPLPISGALLRKIKAPVLLMLGERDNPIGNANEVAKRARRFISRVEVEIIPNAGHMMNTEQPEFVNFRILDFLQE